MRKDHGTLISQLTERLYARVVHKDLKPDDIVGGERELASDFGVSLGTLREAANRLKGLGIITGRQRLGLIVQKPAAFKPFEKYLPFLVNNKTDLLVLLDFRVALETGALQLAIDRITEAQLQEIEKTITPFEDYQNQGKIEAAMPYDIKFHTLLLEASNNEYLYKLHKIISSYFRRLKSEWSNLIGEPPQARTGDHRKLVAAIRAKDRQVANDIILEHLTFIRTRVPEKKEQL